MMSPTPVDLIRVMDQELNQRHWAGERQQRLAGQRSAERRRSPIAAIAAAFGRSGR